MTAPLQRTRETNVPAVSTAGNSDDTVVGQAPFAGKVLSVTYVPEAAITGAATNNRSVILVNKGQDGAGNTTVASLTFGSGTNAAANDERTVALSGAANASTVAEGDTLLWRSVAVGTGIADPGGLVRVTFDRG